MNENKNEVGFLITAFDQIREVSFTIDMLRTKWSNTRKAPIVLVISGDHNRSLVYNDDPYTRVIHLDDIVGPYFKTLVATSIMKQIEHGMIEIKDLERQHGDIKRIIHMHGDILLLGEDGFFEEIKRWDASGKPVAADPVSPGGPWHLPNLDGKGKDYDLIWYGQEIMPQLFGVDHHFCKHTGYLYDMPIIGDLEIKATEWGLIGNLHRAVHDEGCGEALIPHVDVHSNSRGPYENVYSNQVHTVVRGRQQWGLHSHWGSFTHFGNTIKFSPEHRERRNRAALKQYGLDLEAWDQAPW